MMPLLTVAAIQMHCDSSLEKNLAKAEQLVRQAADQGAQVILLPELFERHYFCQQQQEACFAYATEPTHNPAIQKFSQLAKALKVVLPISFYERANQALFNSVAIMDADGQMLGIYRKSHLPDGPGYCEKFYFSPGDTGFKVWDTAFGRIGVGICWDQWFPETARSMALMGAELMLFPSAIGSEPLQSDCDSKAHWQLTQQGQAAANLTPFVVSNRVGTEQADHQSITFYGSSFITNELGEKTAELNRTEEGVLVQSIDLNKVRQYRQNWGVFRDRRPNLYNRLLTQDGRTQ